MLFWIISTILAFAVAGALLLPLLRQKGAGNGASPDVLLYRDQLAEVERDLARGLLDPTEAERTRTEIARRLLLADKAGPEQLREAPRRANLIAGVAAFVVLTGGGLALYDQLGAPGYPDVPLAERIAASDILRATRMSQTEAEVVAAGSQQTALPDSVSQEYLDMVAQLRDIVPTRPDDLQGWELLARHEAALGNFAAAARAQDRMIALKGFDVTTADYVGLVDRLVAAAAGQVSPETEVVLRQILISDPENSAARYYTGLLYAQTDRPDIAFRLWRDLIEQGGVNDPHVNLARLQINDAAFFAGADYTLSEPQRGPSAEDVAAAQDMSEQEQSAMIRGMVDSLSDRLATQGGPPGDWARLIGALVVLGDVDQAQAILTEARSVFAQDVDGLTLLQAAAEQSGLVE